MAVSHSGAREIVPLTLAGFFGTWVVNDLFFPDFLPDLADYAAPIVGGAFGAVAGSLWHQLHSKGQ